MTQNREEMTTTTYSNKEFLANMAQEGKNVRRVARLAGVAFAIAAVCYQANGGNIVKAVKAAKEMR